MNDASRHKTGSARTAGNRPPEPSKDRGRLRCEIRGRLQAVLQELDVQPVDWDIVSTPLAGAVEEIEAAT